MNINSAWMKNNRREIKHTIERFIAIIAIIALGVGFFSGLKISQGAMIDTLDTYINEYNMYDYRLMSTLGLTKEDTEYFSNLDEVEDAEGKFSIDFIGNLEDKRIVNLKSHSITNKINKLDIISGTMPENDNECLVDDGYFSQDDIGTTISVSEVNDKDAIESFKYDKYRIVGLTKSLNYLNIDRGITSLEGGTINAFIYIPEQGFTNDYFSEIFITLHEDGRPYSKEYQSLIANNEKKITDELKLRGSLRYDEIIGELDEKILEAEEEYQEGYDEYLREKSNAETELNNARIELENAEKEIKDNEKVLVDSQEQIKNARAQYNDGMKKYDASLAEFESSKAATLEMFSQQQDEINKNREDIKGTIIQLEESGLTETEEYYTLIATLTHLEEGQKKLDQGREKANIELAAGEEQLINAKAQLDAVKRELDSNQNKIRDGWKLLEEGKVKYKNGLDEYKDGKREAEAEFAKAEDELAKGRQDIDEAKEEIRDITEPDVFVFDRSYNPGYSSFESDTSIVDGMAEVLPIFFFLVAALVCSTTMARMVEEQRTQIGTLKALGYYNGSISRKYIFYSGSAAIIGCIIGYVLGTKLFPVAIWAAYGTVYDFAPLNFIFDINIAIISLVASLICSAGVTYITCKNELNQMPSQLIRPKSPKAGKRVFIDRVPIIWNNISFLHKVSIRNIFRYKKRLIMTTFGIAGCTALMLAALGIKDSIGNLADHQFDNIMVYDYEIYFKEELSQEDIEIFNKDNSDILSESVFISTNTFEIISDGKNEKFNLVATDNPDITNVIKLKSDDKKVDFPEDGKVIINDGLAKKSNISIGDKITIKISDTKNVNAEVSGVFDNYVGNYMYMTGETYEEVFSEKATYKNAYASTNEEDVHAVSSKILKYDNISAVSNILDIRKTVASTMESLNYVVWLVIACAGALAFVVMYNLNNINITERAREIATIKVLGFYNNETHSYVYRENMVLTIFGGFVGLGLGKLLHIFIMNEIQVEAVSFKANIFPLSYVIAFVVTFALTFLVNIMLKKKVDNINMTESLKSVE